MSSPLDSVYGGWEQYATLLERSVSGLDAGQLSLRAARDLWSVRMIACHVVAARAWWFHSWMGEGGDDLARLVDFDEGEEAETGDAAAVVDALRSSWSSVAASLRGWTEADLDERFQRPVPNQAGEQPWRTRGWIIWHVAEHDVHHGGEISLTLGMHGLGGLDL